MVLASIGGRIAARVIDAVAFYAVAWSSIVAAGNNSGASTPSIWTFLMLVLLGAQVYLLTVRGQTIGKKLLRMKVARWGSLENPGFLRAVIAREFVMIFLWWLSVWFLFTEFRRGLHDLVADTVVIKE